MATPENKSNNPPNDENTRRNQVLVGELPSTFLRVPIAENSEDQMLKDGELARQIAQEEITHFKQLQSRNQSRVVYTDRMFISIVEAKLNKNYGMTRMDPFCSVRINHTVYETETCPNGAKNPTWGRPIAVMISEPVETVYIEVFDEGTISGNTKIAWTKITLPESVRKGETLDDWWPLSGGLGEDKEGTVHVIFTQKKFQQQLVNPSLVGITPYPAPGAIPTPNVVHSPAAETPQAPLYTDEDVKQIKDLFPSNDAEVIKTVLEASGGNKNKAIDILLNMQ